MNKHNCWIPLEYKYNPKTKREEPTGYLPSNKQEVIVPDGHIIVHLDKDRTNDDIKNLYCVSRKVNFMLSKNRWHTTDPQLTLAAIKWCEHFYARKETKDEKTKTD